MNKMTRIVNKERARRRHGFTLVEMLVTVGILGFILVALLQFFVEMMSLNDISRDRTVAVSHAQYVLEDIRSSSGVIVDQIDSGEWDLDTDTEFSERGLVRLESEVVDVGREAGADPVVITVDITWQQGNGRQQQVTFTTIDSGV